MSINPDTPKLLVLHLLMLNPDCFNSSQFHLLALRTRSIPRFQLGQFRFVTHMISYFFFNYIHLILIHCLSTCFCNQHPVNLLLHCFLCIFIEMITDNIDCLPDFLCKCVPLCFCIHHFFLSLNPRQRVIPLFSVRTLFFKSGPKWALPVS